MNKEELKEQLKLSKKQNKETRYNYIAQTFNPIKYAIKLEKHVTKILKENQQLKSQLMAVYTKSMALYEEEIEELVEILDIDKGE